MVTEEGSGKLHSLTITRALFISNNHISEKIRIYECTVKSSFIPNICRKEKFQELIKVFSAVVISVVHLVSVDWFQ